MSEPPDSVEQEEHQTAAEPAEVEPVAAKRKRRSSRQPSVTDPESPDAMRLLTGGEFVGAQALQSGSNYTFAVALSDDAGAECIAIYKPARGEVPLWDFPSGTLYRREYCAYLASEALNWALVPPTVIRDGPAGVGSLQFYVPPSRRAAESLYLPAALRNDICRLTLFDHLTNNADRKRSHFLIDRKGRLWGIDHGLTFHAEWKLRTVVFDFAGQPIPAELLDELGAFRGDAARQGALHDALTAQLAEDEVEAFFGRLDELLESKTFPLLDPEANLPRGW